MTDLTVKKRKATKRCKEKMDQLSENYVTQITMLFFKKKLISNLANADKRYCAFTPGFYFIKEYWKENNPRVRKHQRNCSIFQE